MGGWVGGRAEVRVSTQAHSTIRISKPGGEAQDQRGWCSDRGAVDFPLTHIAPTAGALTFWSRLALFLAIPRHCFIVLDPRLIMIKSIMAHSTATQAGLAHTLLLSHESDFAARLVENLEKSEQVRRSAMSA